MNKLKYPDNKEHPWDTSFILENKENKTIETTNLKSIDYYKTQSVFYPYYRGLIDTKDSLHINKLFYIKEPFSRILFGISENGEIYIIDYSSKQKKWIATRLEDYAKDNPKSFKAKY